MCILHAARPKQNRGNATVILKMTCVRTTGEAGNTAIAQNALNTFLNHIQNFCLVINLVGHDRQIPVQLWRVLPQPFVTGAHILNAGFHLSADVFCSYRYFLTQIV